MQHNDLHLHCSTLSNQPITLACPSVGNEAVHPLGAAPRILSVGEKSSRALPRTVPNIRDLVKHPI